MGAAKDMWMDEVERITDAFALGDMGRDRAAAKLVNMGFDLHEAETLLTEAIS